MSERIDSHLRPRKPAQILNNLDKMVAAGRVTKEEAERLEAAAKSGAFDNVARDIRRRHVKARIDAAVEDGSLAQEEAEAILERVENGEDPHFLRGLRRRLRPGGLPPGHDQGLGGFREGGQKGSR